MPVGVTVGLRPQLARIVQPIAQFLAAFPANLLFPLAVSAIVAFRLDPDIWLSPLMILGTQWYILFNVIAGAAAIPSELRDVGINLRVGGWLWWRKIAPCRGSCARGLATPPTTRAAPGTAATTSSTRRP